MPLPSRAFKVHTAQGSQFFMRLDPAGQHCGEQWGRLRMRGFSQSQQLQLDWVGCSYEPRIGASVAVSNIPIEVLEVEGEEVKIYPREEIIAVEELAVPQALAEQAALKGTGGPAVPLLRDEEDA